MATGSTPRRLLGGRYAPLQLIGRGSSAEVWLAEDVQQHRDVALKLFHVSADDPHAALRRRAEARLTAELDHPHLVRVFDADGFDGPDAADGQGWLVMEYVPGITLGQLIAQGPLPGATVARIGEQLAAALAYVHSRGMVHRDIKPANVLLVPGDPADPADLRVKLTDFGIARLLDGTRMTLDGTTVGTANYLSPEQVTGEPIGTASDIYALGLVLLEMLTGTPAYPGRGVEAAIVRLSRPPVVPEHLGRGWHHLLTAMTQRDPQARPDAATVARALAGEVDDRFLVAADARAAGGVPLADAPTGPITRPAPAAHRGRLLLAGAAAAIALAVGLPSLLGDHGRDARAIAQPVTATGSPSPAVRSASDSAGPSGSTTPSKRPPTTPTAPRRTSAAPAQVAVHRPTAAPATRTTARTAPRPTAGPRPHRARPAARPAPRHQTPSKKKAPAKRAKAPKAPKAPKALKAPTAPKAPGGKHR